MQRCATITRKTKETDITLSLDIDGTGKTQIDTGVPFFDHMLDAFGRHGLFDLTVSAKGVLKLMRIIRWKMSELFWVRLLLKQWATSVA